MSVFYGKMNVFYGKMRVFTEKYPCYGKKCLKHWPQIGGEEEFSANAAGAGGARGQPSEATNFATGQKRIHDSNFFEEETEERKNA